MNYTDAFKVLHENNIRCLVTGAVALNLHGVPRMTYDLDLVVDLEEENALKAVRLLLGLGYVCREVSDPEGLAREEMRLLWIDEGRRALRFVNEEADLPEIDLSLETTAPYAELRSRASLVTIHGIDVPVMGLEDLAALKEEMGRPEDTGDLENITIAGEVAGSTEELEDRRREQIRKFHFWPVEQRVEWLLTGSQLRRQAQPASSQGRRGLKKRGKIPGLRHTDLS